VLDPAYDDLIPWTDEVEEHLWSDGWDLHPPGPPPNTHTDDTPQSDASILDNYRICWPDLWTAPEDDEWLCEPFLAIGRAHALYAPAKTGKSLLATWVAAMLATGRPCLTRPGGEPINVIYADLEMTPADLRERLDAMGLGPDTDLERLHWLSLPPLLLDTATGADALASYAHNRQAALVIIDTTARAVTGDENSADTYRAFARHTGIALKRAGIAYLRTDHAGKDLDRGQRGSSAKNDDVDVVWQLAARDLGSFTLKATHRRMGWVPDLVIVHQDDDPLAYRVAADEAFAWPEGTATTARLMDQAGVPLGPTDRAVATAARAAGIKARNQVLRAAARYRRQAPDMTGWTVDNPVDNRRVTGE
jgi:hypothetical protein